MKVKFSWLSSLFLTMTWLMLSSCAQYVSQFHKQIDNDEKRHAGHRHDPYAAYREQGFRKVGPDARPITNPHSISAMNPVKQFHQNEEGQTTEGKPRIKARHFADDGSSGSLWVSHEGSTMFTTEISKKVGDLIIINVMENLRNQISGELKRSFPEPVNPVAKKDDSAKKEAAPKPDTPAGNSEKDEIDTKVYDKISGVVAEEINRDYFLLRGKKEIVFRKNKHLIELQAMVSRKDIIDNDNISSDKLVESRILILR
jgi:flagellar L-ring protein precursor FlgH